MSSDSALRGAGEPSSVGPASNSSTTTSNAGKITANNTTETIKSLSPVKEFKRLTEGRIPCAKQSLLLGFGTLAAVGGVGMISGRSVRRSLNWGVASFTVVSLVNFQICRASRAAEVQRVRVFIEEANRKRAES